MASAVAEGKATKPDDNEEYNPDLKKILKTMKNRRRHTSKQLTRAASLPSSNTLGRPSARIQELRALLLSLEYPRQKWPGEAPKSVVQKFVRMPRTGWRVFKEIYIDKFKINVSIAELKKLAEPSISSKAGNECSRDRFIFDSSKRQKTLDDILDENTLHRAKLLNKVQDAFHKEYASIKSKEPNKVKWTFQNESFQNEILEVID